MRGRLRFLACILSLAFMTGAEARPWTTEDSVRIRYFVEDWRTPDFWTADPGNPIIASPDGSHFLFASRRGDLSCDCAEFRLEVYAVAAVEAGLADGVAPAPAAQAILRGSDSSFFKPGIGEPRWVTNDRIEFLGLDPANVGQLYALDLRTGETKVETDLSGIVAPGGWGMRDVAERAGSRVMLVSTEMEADRSLETYPATEITEGQLVGLVNRSRGRQALVGQRGDARPFLLADGITSGLTGQTASISPDGRWAIADLRSLQPMPDAWLDYDGAASRRPAQYFLADLDGRAAAPVFDAPLGVYTSPAQSPSEEGGWARRAPVRPVWAPDSSRVLLVNTAVPFAGPGSPAHELVRSTGYIVDYEPRTRAWRVLQPVADPARHRWVSDARWLSPRQVLVRYRRIDGPATTQSLGAAPRDGGSLHDWNGRRWRVRELSENEAARFDPPEVAPVRPPRGNSLMLRGISVALRQAANQPPAIVASAGGRELVLTGPDPALDGVDRASWQEFGWREPGRPDARGGLLMPAGWRPGDPPPPVVIQIYRWSPELFRPDGPYANGYAAQALAARGIAVASIGMAFMDDRAIVSTPAEGRAMVERVDAVVDHLAAGGLADRNRVGLIGFSRGGFETSYVISHPGRTRIAASVIADAFTDSYGSYLHDIALWGPDTAVRDEYEGLNGGAFWEARESWLAQAPGFNMHRVQGATLLSYGGYAGAFHYLEHFAALRANARPVEALLFPQGSHQLVRPRERLTYLDATVAWMRFWLKGELPADRLRAARWQRMRRLQRTD